MKSLPLICRPCNLIQAQLFSSSGCAHLDRSNQMAAKISKARNFSAVLSSAVLEWILMLLLLADALYMFLVTSFARACKLSAPCLLCSRLDHLLSGGAKRCFFYSDLMCGHHKLEISSLAYCRVHEKLAHIHGECEICLFSVTTDVSPQDQSIGKGSSDQTICSCCSGPLTHASQVALKGAANSAADHINPNLPTCEIDANVEEELSVVDVVDKLDVVMQQQVPALNSDGVLKVASNSDMDDIKPNSPTCETDANVEDLSLVNVVEKLDVAMQQQVPVLNSNGARKVALNSDVDDIKPNLLTCETDANVEDLSVVDVVDKLDVAMQQDTVIEKEVNMSESHDIFTLPSLEVNSKALSMKDAGAPQANGDSSLEMPANVGIAKPYSKTSEAVIDSDASFGNEIDAQETEMLVSSNEAAIPVDLTPNELSASETRSGKTPADPFSSQELPDVKQNDGVSSDLQSTEMDANSAIGRAVSSSKVTEEAVTEVTGDPNSSLGRQMSISLNEAYKLATHSKSGLLSPTLTDVILGKDCSQVQEELKSMLSQLSAARGIENPWAELGPSPHAQVHGDNSLVLENITRRVSIDRSESGFDSMDGSFVSEIEGESTIDRLKRQIELDRKSISLLLKELEEERNASAIAASHALAMITRLQEEKAAFQMEALQYQRMVEEQAEYDQHALQNCNELLAEREQQLNELKTELESYKLHLQDDDQEDKKAVEGPD